MLTSGLKINAEKFDAFTIETANLFIDKYGWYRMPVSVHKILIHGSQAIAYSLLPIGMLSEEAQESCNKSYKRFREHHTRKNSRLHTTKDLIHMLLVSSDPVISTLRRKREIKKKELLPETVALLMEDSETEGELEEDTEEEDESIFFLIFNDYSRLFITTCK